MLHKKLIKKLSLIHTKVGIKIETEEFYLKYTYLYVLKSIPVTVKLFYF